VLENAPIKPADLGGFGALRCGWLTRFRFGDPNRKYPGDPQKREIESQKNDQAHLRSPLVLDGASKQIRSDVACSHEAKVVEDKCHDALRGPVSPPLSL
jgi:hypothetical protein